MCCVVEFGLEDGDEDVFDVDFDEMDFCFGIWDGDVVDFFFKVDVLICIFG